MTMKSQRWPKPGESEALEFKATTGTRREAAGTVCAFLNPRSGHALFGVTQAGVVVWATGQRAHHRGVEYRECSTRSIEHTPKSRVYLSRKKY